VPVAIIKKRLNLFEKNLLDIALSRIPTTQNAIKTAIG
jgi:hypothetical protein